MVQETILQHWLISKFALPFLLIFVIVYAILVKTKLLGENNQVNAITAFVVGLIFVGAVFPKEVVGNMVLFLTVALVVVFVALLLWGFVSGRDMGTGNILTNAPAPLKWVIGIAVFVAVIIAVLFATGIENSVIDFFFHQNWSESFWTNALFLGMIAIVLAVILKTKTT